MLIGGSNRLQVDRLDAGAEPARLNRSAWHRASSSRASPSALVSDEPLARRLRRGFGAPFRLDTHLGYSFFRFARTITTGHSEW